MGPTRFLGQGFEHTDSDCGNAERKRNAPRRSDSNPDPGKIPWSRRHRDAIEVSVSASRPGKRTGDHREEALGVAPLHLLRRAGHLAPAIHDADGTAIERCIQYQ